MSTKRISGETFAMDGFSKVKPISEGYVVKGGVNAASQIKERPSAPAPIRRPSSTNTAPTNSGPTGGSSTRSRG